MVDVLLKTLKSIENLVRTPGYLYALAELITQDMFLNKEEVATINDGDRISCREASLLLNNLLEQSAHLTLVKPTPERLANLVDQSRQLLDELLYSYNLLVGRDLFDYQLDRDVAVAMTSQASGVRSKPTAGVKTSKLATTFYTVPGIYAFQYLEMALKVYQFDKERLKEKGFDLDQASLILEALQLAAENLQVDYAQTKLQSADEICPALSQFIFSTELILKFANQLDRQTNIKEAEIASFLDFFATPSSSASAADSLIPIESAFKVSDNEYFIPLLFHLASSIYKGPNHWLTNDESYADTAKVNRRRAVAEIIYQFTEKIFGDATLKSLKIMKGDQIWAVIDTVAVIGNVAIIIQQGDQPSGDQSKHKDAFYRDVNFSEDIQTAYNQGLRGQQAILSQPGYKFFNDAGQAIDLSVNIEEVYIMCVTVNVYSAATIDIVEYLNKPASEPWPIPLSLFDLDILTQYLADPHDFAFYVKQRAELTGIVVAAGELNYLAYYLIHGVLGWLNDELFVIDFSVAQAIDDDYLYHRGLGDKPKGDHSILEAGINPNRQKLLNELKTSIAEPNLTEIMFFIKALPDNIIDDFMKQIDELKEKSNQTGLPDNYSVLINKEAGAWAGISYIVAEDMRILKQVLGYFVKVNMRKYKVSKWLAIGSLIGQSNLIGSFKFLDFEPPPVPVPDGGIEHDHKGHCTCHLNTPPKRKLVKKSPKSASEKKALKTKKRLRKLKQKAQRKHRKKR